MHYSCSSTSPACLLPPCACNLLMLFSPSSSAQSSSRSRSTWLDRLRTAKGFPDHDVTDLDNFLQNPNFHNHHQTHVSVSASAPVPVPVPVPTHNQGTQFFNILHDLFNFGHQPAHSTKFKKSARKQPNPRICATHHTDNAPSEKVALLRTGDSNSGVEGAKVEIQREGVERDASLAGFSRTEVTVIDTSYESWKSEKLLYRKKNVWKVRDKKGKSEMQRSKKRRKLEEDQNAGEKLKSSSDKEGRRPDKSPLPPSTEMSKCEDGEEGNHGGEKNARDSKVEEGRSSVILIKSIHNGKKKQRQQSTS